MFLYSFKNSLFQFQCGAIEGSGTAKVESESYKFQFQCGAIEGTSS